jgi:hypothetical protein
VAPAAPAPQQGAPVPSGGRGAALAVLLILAVALVAFLTSWRIRGTHT